MIDGSAEPVIKPHAENGHRDPQQGEGQADLATVLKGQSGIIPDLVITVDKKTGGQLQSGDDHSSRNALQHSWKTASEPADGSQSKKTDAPKNEHTGTASAAPQQFQTHIAHAADIKKDQLFPEFQKNHLENIISEILKIFLDKIRLVSYNDKADFGGSEIPWTMAA